jgi:hypothetical protein
MRVLMGWCMFIGVAPGEMKYVTAKVCPPLPAGCYDVEEGYYNPSDKVRVSV